ncbi:MAG: UbiA prenyltransferase family protein [Lentisphaerae bacterium]|nr:UbiA prenyltransferase family protein [Lentisphaerota bacterium]
MSPFIRIIRVRQWTKNLVVLAPLFFALGDKTQNVHELAIWKTVLTTVFFCALSSGVYVLNDIFDRHVDRKHPVKRLRPVASGELTVVTAAVFGLTLAIIGLFGAFYLSAQVACAMSLYLLLQILYSTFLKQIPLLDVFVISIGFVLRAATGGIAAGINVSTWLFICAFLMALFLALCKRRHEKDQQTELTRPSLSKTDISLLDQLIAITASAVIVSYSVYTQWPDTVTKFGTRALGLSIPFVIFGIFRYLDLVYRHEKGEQPENVLLTDVPLISAVLLYVSCVFGVFRFFSC